MKLIELLVQELPKRGGWPEGAECSTVIEYHMGGYLLMEFIFPSIGDRHLQVKPYHIIINDVGYIESISSNHTITKEQYESVLAASQKPAWNGEGLPPVGCECEYISNGTSWGKVKVIGLDGEKIVIRPSGEIYYAITPSNKDVFIPFRTEEEKKRDIVVGAIKELFKHGDDPRIDDATLIFNAIAAGRIPGVRLDD